MTYERAKAILYAARETAPQIRTLKEKLEKCNARIEAHQKLIASYGTVRVKGGRSVNTIEDAVIKAEHDRDFYQTKIDQLTIVIKRADTIILAMPKKWWKVARMYFVKGLPNRDIMRVKKFHSRTSIYKQLDCLDRYMQEYFKPKE